MTVKLWIVPKNMEDAFKTFMTKCELWADKEVDQV